MNENEEQIREILSVLDREGIIKNVILIGSWCLLFYKSVFEDFDVTVRTRDIDFFVPNPRSIKEKDNLIGSLKSINFDIIKDTLTSKSTFVTPAGFSLEFLTKLTRDQVACVKLGDTDVFAESISYVDIFIGNYIEVDYCGMKIKVASPASYVLQKLLINDKRKEKKATDIESIKQVLQYLNASNKYKEEFDSLFESLPKKWKKTILDNAKNNNINL